jgi:hypothetical protein
LPIDRESLPISFLPLPIDGGTPPELFRDMMDRSCQLARVTSLGIRSKGRKRN